MSRTPRCSTHHIERVTLDYAAYVLSVAFYFSWQVSPGERIDIRTEHRGRLLLSPATMIKLDFISRSETKSSEHTGKCRAIPLRPHTFPCGRGTGRWCVKTLGLSISVRGPEAQAGGRSLAKPAPCPPPAPPTSQQGGSRGSGALTEGAQPVPSRRPRHPFPHSLLPFPAEVTGS